MKRRKVLPALTAILLSLAFTWGASGAAVAASDKYRPFPPKCTHVEVDGEKSTCIVLY